MRADFDLAALAAHLEVSPDTIWALTDEKSIKIDSIRRLQQELSTAPATKGIRHVAIFPAERITQQAQQALLKLIEEPPARTQITLATSAVTQVLPTIQSRCVVRLAKAATESTNTETSLFEKLSHCTSWKEVVTLSQELPSKREELRPVLQSELSAHIPPSQAGVQYQETLLEVLDALNNNVQPALCAEKLLFSVYTKNLSQQQKKHALLTPH
ncbi:hypothetical protein LRY60_04230 [Candidatus Woesebacteria bacterium]|nr:hypothetical protein [Candidatus Woesebacteria bacterium]